MKYYLLLLFIMSYLSAGVFNAGQVRAANRAYLNGEVEKAKTIYRNLPDGKLTRFNKALINRELAAATPQDQAKLCLNLGNEALRQGDLDKAKSFYRRGLRYDHRNRSLKNNLEIIINAKVPPKKNDQQKKEQDDPKRKNAERQLDAFKNDEQEALRQMMRKGGEKKDVEKDW